MRKGYQRNNSYLFELGGTNRTKPIANGALEYPRNCSARLKPELPYFGAIALLFFT